MTDELVLIERQSGLKRLLLGTVGALVLIIPAKQLHPWTLPFWPFGLGFGIIVVGAAGIGLTLLAAALLSENTELRLSRGKGHLRRTGLLLRDDIDLRRGDVLSVKIRQHAWETGPPSYTLTLLMRGDLPVSSGELATLSEAEALKAQIETVLASL